MKAAQGTAAGTGLRIVELEIPDLGPEQVRINVQACGVCHSDAIVVEDRRPGIPYPLQGYEVAGVVDVLGSGRIRRVPSMPRSARRCPARSAYCFSQSFDGDFSRPSE